MVSLVLFLCALVALSAGADSCAFQGRTPYPLEQVRRCVVGVPYNASLAAQVIDSVEKTMYLYAFRDMVNNPPDSPLMRTVVNIGERLRAIANSPFTSEFNFYTSINNLFIALRDPHTVFVKPRLCYSFFFLLGVNLGSRLDSTGAQEIFISGAMTQFFPQYSKYTNFTVTKIDGVDAMQVLTDFAFAKVFISKDAGNAFNNAIASQYTERYAGIYDFPASANTTWTLRAPGSSSTTQVTFNWQVVTPSSVNITASNCVASNARRHEERLRAVAERSSKKEPWMRAPEVLKTNSFANTMRFQAQEPDITFVNITNDVMLLRIATFEPSDEDGFLQTLTDGIAFASKNDISQLIIDVSGNGGGDICLGYTVISLLLSEAVPSIGSYDVIHSPLTSTLANAAASTRFANVSSLFSPNMWRTIRGRQFVSSEWYWGAFGTKYFYNRGGLTSSYSTPMEIFCPAPPKVDASVFKKAILVSDGLAGSTAAVFSSHIAHVEHVRTAVFGGISSIGKQQYFSFPGGLVYRIDSLLGDVDSFQLDGYPYVPAMLPGGGELTFALLEIYPWKTQDWSTPLEFLFDQSDYLLPHWCFDPSCKQPIYNDAIKLLSTFQ